jgi:hypothetical protein
MDVEQAALSERNHSVRSAWYKATKQNVSQYKTDKLKNLQYNKDTFLCANVFCTNHKNYTCAL